MNVYCYVGMYYVRMYKRMYKLLCVMILVYE